MRESRFAAAALFLVCAFQIALVLGAPWGSITQGGFDTGALETQGRVTAAVSAVLLFAMAQITLAVDGEGLFKKLNARALRVFAWISTGYSGLGVLVNLASPSLAEKLIWVPVVGVVFVLQLRTILRTKKR
jgi:hypothetical protein